MKRLDYYFEDKYHRLEAAFFVIYFVLFPMLSSIEYYIYESPAASQFDDIPERLTYGLTSMIPPWICYKFVIQSFLFRKKYLEFAGLLLVYLVLHNAYRIGVYWVVSNSSFLPVQMVARAKIYYSNNSVFHHIITIFELRDLLVLSSLAYFIRSARQDKKISELQKMQIQTELNYLKVQMQPHFFFNTLNNIYALTLQRSEKAAPLVAKHADMMRYILYESSGKPVELKKEIAFIQNYIEIEAMHHSENIDISLETQGIIDSAFIEPLLILPFIENMFKHGIRQETGMGYVHIIISLVENELSMELKNSKPAGMNNAQKGIGLQNARKRLEMLYPEKHTLEVDETPDSYEIRLSLTLNSYDPMYHS
ncbi:histidine kinase [Daejeonella sp.]|uniref:sensor histidine kinase n=1 Tax=Daejeonella sp. TaxID=2805397 RepID=UPI0030BAF89C